MDYKISEIKLLYQEQLKIQQNVKYDFINNCERITVAVNQSREELKNKAFNYKENYDYSRHPYINIGKIDNICIYCRP